MRPSTGQTSLGAVLLLACLRAVVALAEAIALVAACTGLPLVLGLDGKFMVLFMLSILVIMMSFSTGRTTVLQGIVLLVIFALTLFLLIFP